MRVQAQQIRCQVERLDGLEHPEDPLIETRFPNNKQIRCAGVPLSRPTLLRNGLRRPLVLHWSQEIFMQQPFWILWDGIPRVVLRALLSHKNLMKQGTETDKKVTRFREDIHCCSYWYCILGCTRTKNSSYCRLSYDIRSSITSLIRCPWRDSILLGTPSKEFLQYEHEQGESAFAFLAAAALFLAFFFLLSPLLLDDAAASSSSSKDIVKKRTRMRMRKKNKDTATANIAKKKRRMRMNLAAMRVLGGARSRVGLLCLSPLSLLTKGPFVSSSFLPLKQEQENEEATTFQWLQEDSYPNWYQPGPPSFRGSIEVLSMVSHKIAMFVPLQPECKQYNDRATKLC
uniref:Legumin seed storage protein n=1 Tax=Cajanus cajan TaxID=3821 RepID=Q94FS2_CAJCA|nr:legumin seed storage protein [Cajanus cajan]